MTRLLSVEDLHLCFRSDAGSIEILRGMTFSLARGECVALVGQSGSGKSVTGLAILRLLGPAAHIPRGAVRLGEQSLLDLPEARMRAVRGGRIAMVFQNVWASLNPIRRVGDTLVDIMRTHDPRGLSRRQALQNVVGIMDAIGIDRAAERARSYPSELSGGMCQRIGIAAVLACRPELVIADEPTSALDVTTQQRVMDILTRECRERGTAMLFVTHDLALAAAHADRVLVTSEGRIVEEGPTHRVLTAPEHPCTSALVGALLPAPARSSA